MFTSRSYVIMLCFSLLFMFLLKNSYGRTVIDDYKNTYNELVLGEVDKYESGKYAFEEGAKLRIYKSADVLKGIDGYEEPETVLVHSIEERNGCLGLTTKSYETIVLDCPEEQSNEPGCFYIFSSSGNGSDNDETEVKKACVEILNEGCVGIVTPKNWTIPLHCIKHEAHGNS